MDRYVNEGFKSAQAVRRRAPVLCLPASRFYNLNKRYALRQSGEIVLTGIIKKDGKVEDVAIATSQSAPSIERDSLTSAARDSFAFWRFDSGPQDIPVKLTFAYVIDAPGGTDNKVIGTFVTGGNQ